MIDLVYIVLSIVPLRKMKEGKKTSIEDDKFLLSFDDFQILGVQED